MTPFFVSFDNTTNSPLRIPQISMNFMCLLANIIECHNGYPLIMIGCFSHDVWVGRLQLGCRQNLLHTTVRQKFQKIESTFKKGHGRLLEVGLVNKPVIVQAE